MVFSFPPEERVPFSQPRKDDGACVATAPGRVGWDNTTIKKGTIGAKERKKRNNNQKVYFLFLLMRGRPSQQGKMMARARRCGKGAFSVPQRAWDGTTQQSKLCCHGSFFIFISEPKPKPFSFQHVTIASHLERCMSCCVLPNYLLERCKFFR